MNTNMNLRHLLVPRKDFLATKAEISKYNGESTKPKRGKNSPSWAKASTTNIYFC